MQQGQQPTPHGESQQRNRRAQRYEQPTEQITPPIPEHAYPLHAAYPAPSSSQPYHAAPVNGFPDRDRTVYQPANIQTPLTLSPPRQMKYPEDNGNQKRISPIRWVVVVLVCLMLGSAGTASFLNAQSRKTTADTLVAQPSSLPTTQPTASPTTVPTDTPAITAVPYSTLSEGSSGLAVQAMQQRLITLGYLNDKADGVYGPKTSAAVAAYQAQNNITSTGVADSQTQDSLFSYYAIVAATDQPATKAPAAYTASSSTGATTSQRNALQAAYAYLNFTAFSYQGLIEQLEYEKYSHADAVYAVDHCGADWNEQALQSAASYLDYTAFSYQGLIDQLEYEGFTSKQATYAADRCGANWNEQAVLCAQNYLDFMSFSRDGLIDQLEYEGFTHSQAVYGAKQNGL